MWITIIILAYVASVFLSRWLNKLLYRKDKFYPIVPLLWFTPAANVLVLLAELCIEYTHAGDDLFEGKTNKFTGKHW